MWNHVFIPHYWGGNEISLYPVFCFSLPLRLIHWLQMGFPLLHHDNGRHASCTAPLVSKCSSLKLNWNLRMHISHSHIEHVLPARVKFAALMIIKAELIITITHTLIIIPQTVSHLLWGKWQDSFSHSRVVSDGCKGIRKCLWPSSRYQAWHSSFWMQSYQNRAKRMKNRYCLKNRDATRKAEWGSTLILHCRPWCSSPVYFTPLSVSRCAILLSPSAPNSKYWFITNYLSYRPECAVHHCRCSSW